MEKGEAGSNSDERTNDTTRVSNNRHKCNYRLTYQAVWYTILDRKGGIMNIQPATLKIGEAYNNCPGREVIERELGELKGWSYVDTDREFWQNEPDTMVIEIPAESPPNVPLEIGIFAVDYGADEMHRMKADNGNQIVRLWWD